MTFSPRFTRQKGYGGPEPLVRAAYSLAGGPSGKLKNISCVP